MLSTAKLKAQLLSLESLEWYPIQYTPKKVMLGFMVDSYNIPTAFNTVEKFISISVHVPFFTLVHYIFKFTMENNFYE